MKIIISLVALALSLSLISYSSPLAPPIFAATLIDDPVGAPATSPRLSDGKWYSYDTVFRQSFNNGATWSSPRLPHTDATPTEQLVDDLICDCCQTDVAIAASGPVAGPSISADANTVAIAWFTAAQEPLVSVAIPTCNRFALEVCNTTKVCTNCQLIMPFG